VSGQRHERKDKAIEKSAMGKIYLRLLPFAILNYFLAYIDRINVSFAGLTMRSDSRYVGRSYTWEPDRRRPSPDARPRD
jgi:hypothetical protein